jgi:hypothetical protein
MEARDGAVSHAVRVAAVAAVVGDNVSHGLLRPSPRPRDCRNTFLPALSCNVSQVWSS